MGLHRVNKGYKMQEQVEPIDDFVVVDQAPQTQEVESAEVDEHQDVEQAVEAESAEGEELELVIEDTEASPASTVEQDDIEIPDDAPNWAKQLRQRQKELARENRQLKTQQQQAAQYEPEVFNEPFPEIEDPDVEFDPAKLKAKVLNWTDKKAKFETSQSSKKAEFEQMQTRYSERLTDYQSKKVTLQKQFTDYDKAEAAVINEVPQTVQNAILLYADDPSLIVLAAGRNKEVRDKLTKLQNDPVALGVEIGRLSKMVKVSSKPKPTIEPAPTVRAPAGKPIPADEKRFRELLPDAKFS